MTIIYRVIATAIVLVGAYIAVPLIAPYLPVIHLKVETPPPESLDDVISSYVTHESNERVSINTSAYVADWDTVPKHTYTLYQLSNQIPTPSREYTGNGNELESNYESFLLSLRPTQAEDPSYYRLLETYKHARVDGSVKTKTAKKSKKPVDPKQEALNALVGYLERRNSGPTEARLGRALRMYYGDDKPQIELPDGHSDNLRRVSTAPALESIRDPDTIIPTVEFVVPGVRQTPDGARVAQAQQLKLVSLTITRPWLDLDLLMSSQNGPWYGGTPSFFGPTGTIARIPVRIVLLQRPQIQVSSAKTDASGTTVSVGPFSYSTDEVTTNGNILQLKPSKADWIVYAIVYKEL